MGGLIFIESDVPGDMTLAEWRRARRGPRRCTRLVDRLKDAVAALSGS